MKVFYLQPITDDILVEKLRHEMEGEIISYDRISSSRQEEPYETKDKFDLKYLQHVKGLISDVGDLIRDFLPRFFSSQRADFDYVRKYNVGFLNKHELLLRVRVKTEKEEKELSLRFDMPSYLYIPRILYKIKGQYVYLHNHLESRISFVIGNPENPKTDNYLVDDAMEELWHLAIHPCLIEKLNRNLGGEEMKPDENMSKILMDGEYLAKAFTSVSFDKFKEEIRHHIPSREITEIGDKGKILVDTIKNIGIKQALKEIGRHGMFDM